LTEEKREQVMTSVPSGRCVRESVREGRVVYAYVPLPGIEVHVTGACVVDVRDQRLTVGGDRMTTRSCGGRRARRGVEQETGGDTGNTETCRAAQQATTGQTRSVVLGQGRSVFACHGLILL
jgi:hypothetical protein